MGGKPTLEESVPIIATTTKPAVEKEVEEKEAEPAVEEVVEGESFEIIQIETVAEPQKEVASSQDEESFLPEIPSHAQYLIVGGGTAAMSAFKAIRASDPSARVLVVTEEHYKPYMRPPLSKDMWTTDDEKLIAELRFKQYNGSDRSLLFLEDEFYVKPKFLNREENGGVAVLTGKRVIEVDIEAKRVKLDNNWEIAYDKCLIATGGKPKNLPIFEKSWDKFKDKVTLFRNVRPILDHPIMHFGFIFNV